MPPPGFSTLAQQQLCGAPSLPGAVWDQHALANIFHTMTLTLPPNMEWYMDTCANCHMTSDSGNLLTSQPPSSSHPTSIVIGNGSPLLVTSNGHTLLPALDRPLHLCHVLISPDIIKKILFPYVNLLLIIKSLWNLIPLVFP
jgi:hypothetical protein